MVVVVSASAPLLVGLPDHVHSLLHLCEVFVAEIGGALRSVVALEHGLVAWLPAVIEAHVDPGSFPHTQILAHIHVFVILPRLMIGHLSFPHVVLEGLLTAFLNDFYGFVLSKNVFFWQIFGRKLPLKGSFAAFPEFERLWRANLDVPFEKLDILNTWVPSQVVDQS